MVLNHGYMPFPSALKDRRVPNWVEGVFASEVVFALGVLTKILGSWRCVRSLRLRIWILGVVLSALGEGS